MPENKDFCVVVRFMATVTHTVSAPDHVEAMKAACRDISPEAVVSISIVPCDDR
jgi:hypothetical protein